MDVFIGLKADKIFVLLQVAVVTEIFQVVQYCVICVQKQNKTMEKRETSFIHSVEEGVEADIRL